MEHRLPVRAIRYFGGSRGGSRGQGNTWTIAYTEPAGTRPWRSGMMLPAARSRARRKNIAPAARSRRHDCADALALVLGALAAAVYNPSSAALREQSKRLEADLFGERQGGLRQTGGGFWVRQKSAEGQAIINANSSREQGALLGGVTIFAFDASGRFRERIEAKSAELRAGHWRLEQAIVYAPGTPTRELDAYSLSTNLTREQ